MSRPRPVAVRRAALILLSFLTIRGAADVVLNEVLADNRGVVANGPDFPDYVELVNRGAAPVSLDGWSLTDDPAQPRRFVFPVGTSIPAGGRLVVWCDTAVASPGLHSGFGLAASGDLVRLYRPDGTTLADEVVFGFQAADLGLGRVPDATGGWRLNVPSPLEANAEQPVAVGPSLRINEWMARPTAGDDWLEVFNPEDLPAAMGGMVLTDRDSGTPANRAIPELSFIAAGGHRQFFASDLRQPDADHLDFRLGADGETLTLYGADRLSVVDRVSYGVQVDDISQGRVPDGGDTITDFTIPSPGRANTGDVVGVVINEVLSHSDPPFEDAIELHNPTAEPLDISHWWLSDSVAEARKFRIPAGTVVPPGGFVVFYDAQFGAGDTGFSLNSFEGDSVVLSSGDASGNLTGRQTRVRFSALRNGLTVGRVATSVGVDFAPLARMTFGRDQPVSLEDFRLGTGATNAGPRVGPVVVTEIHFQPDGDATDEFIELHNPTAGQAPLFHPSNPAAGSRLRDGISFDFPAGTIVPPGGFALVVGFDPADAVRLAAFRSRYAVPAGVPVFGPWSGRLSDSGEVLEFQQPDEIQGPDSPNPGFVPFEVAERIRYFPGFPWPAGASGTGNSLQRREPLAYGNEPLNWLAASPTPGAPAVRDPDRDDDGLPDDWELANGLDPEDPDDADLDRDVDGQSNRDEYVAGTDPRDPASLFRIDGLLTGPPEWRVTFPAVAGRAYTVEFRSDVGGGGWQTVATVPTVAASGAGVATFPPPAGPSGILRMTVRSGE